MPPTNFSRLLARAAIAALAFTATSTALAQDTGTLNLYSARHYNTDEALYANFTKATGIRIRRVDADDAGIIARLKSEGDASPADVVLLVDAARLYRGEADGLFKPIRSPLLETAIAPQYRAANSAEGTSWFGFSTRARLVVYDKLKVKREDVDTYEKLADPINKGRVCTRSGSHPYNLSLFGAMVEHLGDVQAEAWLKGLVANMARSPRGGDTDQVKAIGAGECQVALVNSYYVARLLRSSNPEERTLMERVGIMFPNQASWGTHMNIAGGAVARYSKNTAAAQRFLEYLASEQAQEYFANGNNEWPVVRGTRITNPALAAMTSTAFKSETIPLAAVGSNQGKVQQMLDRVGFK